jgi:hypothetical protein
VIPEGANPVNIAKYALAKITERRVPEQETYHAKVLHAKGNIFAKPGTYGAVLDYLGIGETRTMAICRIIEKHSCIPDPDLNRDPKTGDMTSYDKMCLNLHAQAATYYTAPGTDLPLDAGDIVMVMPKDRLILRIVEKSPHGPGQRDRGPAARGLFEDGAVVLAEDFVAHVSPDASAFVSKMKASDLGNFSNEFLLGLAANAQHESGFCANNAGDPNTTVSGERAHAIEKPDCKSRIRKFCSFGYWQMNICGKASDTTYGGVRFAIYYGIDINDKETLYAAITDPDKQFEFMYHDAQTLFSGVGDVYASEVNGLTGEALAGFWGGQIADWFENCRECANPEGDRLTKGNNFIRGTSQFTARQNLAKSMYREGVHMAPAETSG